MAEPVTGTLAADHGASIAKPRVLIVSLVHPDFLAPLYSAGKVLRDAGCAVDIFSFTSKAAGSVALPSDITIHDCGAHAGSTFERYRMRREFSRRVETWIGENPIAAILASCPFSALVARRLQPRGVPTIYWSFELYDVRGRDFRRSPATALRNWRMLRSLSRMDIVCTPAAERSAWLQRRARLRSTPLTVLNAPYGGDIQCDSTSSEGAESFLPVAFRHRRLVVHTGNVTRTQAVLELIDSMRWWPADACLALTNVGDSAYASEVRRSALESPRAADIVMLPLLERRQMLMLQRLAVVGACFIRPGDNLESSMPAPNKVGEYLHAGLMIAGLDGGVMSMLAKRGVAELSAALDPELMGRAIAAALGRGAQPGIRDRMLQIARSWYSMEVQFAPVLAHLRAAGLNLTV